MALQREDVLKWTVEEVTECIKERFGEDVAAKFAEEDVDGETAVMLADAGSSDNFRQLGLLKIKQQLLYKKHFSCSSTDMQPQKHQLAKAMIVEDRKLKANEIECLSEEEKKIYLIRRNHVHAATVETWPGNSLPIFKGSEESKAKLKALVERLVPDCCYSPASLPGVKFGKKGIHKHITDCLNERRRVRRKGHDFEKPKAKKMKSCVEEESNNEKKENEQNTSEEKNECEEKNERSASEEKIDECEEKNEQSASERNDCEDKQRSSDDEESEESDNEEEFEDEEEMESNDWEEELSMKSCEVILMTAFDSKKMKDLPRAQLMTAVKKLCPGLKKGTEKKNIIKPLAIELIKRKHVKVDTSNYSNVKRAQVTKLAPF